MSDTTPTLTPEIEALKEAYAALNRNDILSFVKDFDEDIEWVEFTETPGGGTYKGRPAIEAHATQTRGTVTPQRLKLSTSISRHASSRLAHLSMFRSCLAPLRT